MEIVKPRTDTREYRRIVLRNSLGVLLISDPDTDKVTLSILMVFLGFDGQMFGSVDFFFCFFFFIEYRRRLPWT